MSSADERGFALSLAARFIVGATTRGMYVFLKHLVLSEAGQNPKNINTWLTEQTLREIYLKPFEIAVKEGEANAVMSAFNRVGGVNANENYTLLTEVLRGEWKFKGCVITDYDIGDPKTFIRSGGDIRLGPHGKAGLSESSKADVYCGVRAVKNLLYTYCNTYYRAKLFDPDREVEMINLIKAFPWWIPSLISLNILLVGILACQYVRLIFASESAIAKTTEYALSDKAFPSSFAECFILYKGRSIKRKRRRRAAIVYTAPRKRT